VLGHSEQELARLGRQAKLIDPITRQFLIQAGVTSGMRILDVGCGAGDVSFIAADLVGSQGEVIGVDRSPNAIETARVRAADLRLSNVKFMRSELSDIDFGPVFSAVTGRYVLCFQSNPAAILRTLVKQLQPEGKLVFHEPARDFMTSYPPSPTYDQSSRWLTEAYPRSGVDINVGLKLYSLFVAAGLDAPEMRCHAVIGGAGALDVIHFDADQSVVLADEIVRLGIASSDELSPSTLVERIVQELSACGGVIIGRGEIGAWASKS
jgi:ubiquinone/menaquinone biosynthesis C-methylase UbiE